MGTEHNPSSEPTQVLLRIVHALILSISSAFIIALIVIALVRLFYPFELEWLEGISIDQSRWILDGHFLYSQPTIHFIPMIYGPIFFYISAFLMHFLGIGFTAARLVSVLSTAGSLVLLFSIISRSTSNKIAGLLAAGIFAASYRFAGAWMDLAKVDSLALFLMIAGFWISQRFPSRAGMIGSSALYVLAYYTKANAVIVILAMLVLSLIESRGRKWLPLVSAAVISAAIYLTLNIISQGWYSFYTSTSVLQGFTYYQGLGVFLSRFFSAYWPVILGIAFFFILKGHSLFHNSLEGQQSRAIVIFAVVLIASGWITFLHRWSYDNDFLPACLGIAILAGLEFAEISRRIFAGNLYKGRLPFLASLLAGLFVLQFVNLRYNPFAQIPGQADKALWVEFISRLEKLPGQVWVFNHGFVNYLANKTSYVHSNPYGDAASFANTEEDVNRRALVRQIRNDAIHEQEFEWIVAGKSTSNWWLPYYIYSQDLFEKSRVFFSVTGMAQPEVIFRRNPLAHGGVLPLSDPAWNFLFGDGWNSPEDVGRQVIGDHSTIQLSLESGHDYRIVLQVQPSCQSPFMGEKMKLAWNQNSIGDFEFTSCLNQSVSFELPAREVTGKIDKLSFDFVNSSIQVEQENSPLSFAAMFSSISFIQEP